VLFAANYFLSKSYCERPDAVARLSSAIAEVCGTPVAVQIRSAPAASSPASNASSSSRNTSIRRSNSSAQNDPFVQQALAVFGGSVAEVRESVAAAASNDESSTG
jgi:DNA polymerase III subunit gamma/tau